MEVLKERNVSLPEVKSILEKKKREYAEKNQELIYEQRRALEHARKYAKLSLKDAEDLMKKLANLEIKLTEEQIVKIIDIMPKTVDDIRAIFAKERFKYDESKIKEILDLLEQYR